MFGYVLPPPDLPPEELERFRRMYCGLCHTLGTRYGPAARWILNYDFTFLAILLSGGGEPETRTGRCAVHPIRPRTYAKSCAALELAADESVILAWHQLLDGAEDHAFGLPWRTAAAVLDPARRRAAEVRPAFDGTARRRLDDLHTLERENCPSLDRPADAFASLLRDAAAEVSEPTQRRVLEQFLYHLGRWIYLIDAADDLRRDCASGNYNPVSLRFRLTDGAWTPEARTEFALTLDHSVHAMAAALELGNFGVWRPLLEAVVYRGLFQTGRAVLDGTFRRGFRRAGTKKPGKAGDAI